MAERVGTRASSSARAQGGNRLVAEAKTVLVAFDYERTVTSPPLRLGVSCSPSEHLRAHHAPERPRVLTAPLSHAKSVTCFLMLAAGSRYETRETNGIAHFTEHMVFKGTERRRRARTSQPK